MSFFWDLMRHGVPVVTAVGAFSYLNVKERSTTSVLLGTGAGWAVGWGIQWGLSRLLDGPGESLPTQTASPSIASGSVQIPGADEVLDRGQVIDMQEARDKKAGSVSGVQVEEQPPQVAGPVETPMGTRGPPKQNADLKPQPFVGFDPNNLGSDSSN